MLGIHDITKGRLHKPYINRHSTNGHWI